MLASFHDPWVPYLVPHIRVGDIHVERERYLLLYLPSKELFDSGIPFNVDGSVAVLF